VSVSAFAPHAVFADGIKDSFLSAFDHFYTTDTIPENHERFTEKGNVQVLHFL
jgi:phosphoribosylpyrophosphate synthetase